MNTTQLECFLQVANFLNFSRAAEQLRITQPAVSHQISSLEEELGTKLFFRTSKSVRLTQAGHLFTQYANEILKLSGLSKARLKECQATLPLRFGIGCRNFMELRLLRPVLAQLHQEQPRLLPVLRLLPYASLENLLAEDDVQVLLSLQESAPPKAVYRELIRCPLVCICSETHPLAVYDQLTIEQVKNGGRIATCPPPIYPPALFSVQNQVVAERNPDQMLFCDNLEIVHTLVEAGYAFAIMPDLRPARIPGLRYIPIPAFSPISFGAVYHSGGLTPTLRLFLSALGTLLQNSSSPLLPSAQA